jgi:hypothetical protein
MDSPLTVGEGAPKGRVRVHLREKSLADVGVASGAKPNPHPALRVTFSRGEKGKAG